MADCEGVDVSHRICTIDGCDRKHEARGYCKTHYNRLHLPKEKRHKRKAVACVVCGTEVMRRDEAQRYQPVCSTVCRTIYEHGGPANGARYDWATDAVRRAKRLGAPVVEVFTREDIFERDRWICYLCEKPCDRDADTCDPMSPTVDHVVPLTKGGEHSRANARTACLGCNSAKCDRLAISHVA